MCWIPGLSMGFLEVGLLYPREWSKIEACHMHLYDLGLQRQAEVGSKESDRLLGARNWEGLAETLVTPDTSGVGGCCRWGYSFGQ